jgi:hypothetical protein
MKLWNIHPHSPPGQCIEATDLLHFTANAVANWECNEKECKKDCPWWCKSTVYCTNEDVIRNNLCILDAIKDCAFQTLDPETKEE